MLEREITVHVWACISGRLLCMYSPSLILPIPHPPHPSSSPSLILPIPHPPHPSSSPSLILPIPHPPHPSSSPSLILPIPHPPQVQHILISTSPSGRSVVWDLRKNDPIIQINDSSSRIRCKAVAWHPDVATQMVTASEDDRAPIIQVKGHTHYTGKGHPLYR